MYDEILVFLLAAILGGLSGSAMFKICTELLKKNAHSSIWTWIILFAAKIFAIGSFIALLKNQTKEVMVSCVLCFAFGNALALALLIKKYFVETKSIPDEKKLGHF